MVDYRDQVLRRRLLKATLAMGLTSIAEVMFASGAPATEPAEINLPPGLAAERWDFEA